MNIYLVFFLCLVPMPCCCSSSYALFLNLVCYLIGNMGGRDSPRSGSIPQADESWTTVGGGPRNNECGSKEVSEPQSECSDIILPT